MSQKTLNILVLSDSFHGYGAEKMLIWVGNMYSENAHNVTFCSIFDKDINSRLSESADYISLNTEGSLKDRCYNATYFMSVVKAIIDVCKKKPIDYVVTFHTNPFLAALMARPFCGYKLLHSERDNPFARNTIPSRFKTWLYRFADKIVFQTEGAQSYFGEKVRKKSVIIPNPIEIPTFSWKYEDARKTIASVGRLDIHFKRQDLLFEAFAEIAHEFPEYKIVFYGDGKDRDSLELMAKDLGIDQRLLFLGKVSNVAERLVKEGLFVMTSDSEGMPNALMEAMALGMPVISTDCEPGGARALIDNGVDGLISKRSDKEDLVNSLRTLLSDSGLQKCIGMRAKRKMETFNPDIISNMWLNCIE